MGFNGARIPHIFAKSISNNLCKHNRIGISFAQDVSLFKCWIVMKFNHHEIKPCKFANIKQPEKITDKCIFLIVSIINLSRQPWNRLNILLWVGNALMLPGSITKHV